jgi:hypothetical protein
MEQDECQRPDGYSFISRTSGVFPKLLLPFELTKQYGIFCIVFFAKILYSIFTMSALLTN